jgi:2-polyprenyl-3-methyl-5-hydroxy-6-metoxy-1,4-benzoquinol methylase
MQNNQCCPICASVNINKVKKELSECEECRLQFLSTIQSPEYYTQIYNKGYFNGEVYNNYLKEEDYRRRVFQSKLKLIKKYIPCEGSVLDIGCGMGFFLMEMQKSGYHVNGLEISAYAADIALEKVGAHINCGNLLNTSLKLKHFDIITLWDVLEHLYNPVESLKKISQIINPDGVLIIETLNISSLTAKILKDNWPLYYPPYHLYYYNYSSLSRLLEKTGFKIIKSFPVQTYIKLPSGYRAFRYFKYPIIRDLAGLLFDDVVIYVAVPF